MLKKNGNRNFLSSVSCLSKDESGAVIIYVTILAAVLIGFVGLATDIGRFSMSNSQAVDAADAAALAAASQLDGSSSSITRAMNAAINTPLIANSHTYAAGVDSTGLISITDIRFLSDLPPDDSAPITEAFETTDPFQARFVEVTTEKLTHTNMFIVAIGAGGTAFTSATPISFS